MAYKKLTHTRNQHTTPRCYLKNFSDNGKQIYRKHKRPFTTQEEFDSELKSGTSLSTATVIEDFYTVKSGNEPMMVETMIYAREIENHYPRIYKILTDPTVQGFDMEARVRLLMCMLSLHCRTPKQFRLFFETVKGMISAEELEKVKEDYKGVHVLKILPALIAAHEFKIVKVFRVADNSEFITSDNPVLIIGSDNQLKNNIYREQFNIGNRILIPIDRKHCCVLTQGKDKNGIDIHNKVFYNRITREDVTASFVIQANYFMMSSADKSLYGSKHYLNGYFNFWKFTE